jgi:Spy/CpxP family protein refolding chaperone
MSKSEFYLAQANIGRMRWLFVALLIGTPAWAQEPQGVSPYVGLETREIKALGLDEIAAYENGDGMRYALAAELNHYPGPKHVLELSDDLELSTEQRKRVEQVFEAMRGNARDLGVEIVAAERELDVAFANGTIDDDQLQQRTAAIAALQGELRAAHLAAHLTTRTVLTPEQVERYDALRGYTGGHDPAHHQPGGDAR